MGNSPPPPCVTKWCSKMVMHKDKSDRESLGCVEMWGTEPIRGWGLQTHKRCHQRGFPHHYGFTVPMSCHVSYRIFVKSPYECRWDHSKWKCGGL